MTLVTHQYSVSLNMFRTCCTQFYETLKPFHENKATKNIQYKSHTNTDQEKNMGNDVKNLSDKKLSCTIYVFAFTFCVFDSMSSTCILCLRSRILTR